ncbi:hypothetical protein HLK59_49455, partial [Streptomyces sp. S3(2020)]|uniref:hypothetical protein n=1 Tax=Streptomyces sp. S3(2020) TaxID=2732044 RepID=UPI001489DD73
SRCARPRGWRIENMPSCPAHVAAVAIAAPAEAAAPDILARRLPTECLYTDDATERIAAERQVCPNWE